jgi:acetyl-CoA carboxylase biotin carboxyl carrier protein
VPAALAAQPFAAPAVATASGSGSIGNPEAIESAVLVMAPLYGVLHVAPAPDAPAFVQLGDTVQTGQTLCVVEAMKMFHEVRAPRSGKVAAIFAVAGEEVEAGAALYELAAQDGGRCSTRS